MAWGTCSFTPGPPGHPPSPLPGSHSPSLTHSCGHLRLLDSHSPGPSHTPACRCSGHPPRGWGSCRWGRCQRGNSGWVAVPGLSGVPWAGAAAAALPPVPSGTRTGGTPGPSWCGQQWPEASPAVPPGDGARQGLLRGRRHLPSAPRQASLLLVRLQQPQLPPPSQWSPLGCAASEKRKVSARKPPLLSLWGRELRQGPEAGFISWAPPAWERANLMPVTGGLLAPLSRG